MGVKTRVASAGLTMASEVAEAKGEEETEAGNEALPHFAEVYYIVVGTAPSGRKPTEDY